MHMMPGFLFPGQGSQFVGMGRDLASHSAGARQILQMADDIMDCALTTIMWEGPEERLRDTRFTQPAILTHSLAVLALLRERIPDLAPAIVAGHSLGEYGALVAAGVLSPRDALTIVKRRGELMAEAGATTPGAMAAILGLSVDIVLQLIRCAGEAGVVVPANLNAPDQIVVSGAQAAVERVASLATEAGAKRVVPLAVSGAFHSPLMGGVARELALVVNATPFGKARCPVVPNATAKPTSSPDELRGCVLAQIEQPVRWVESMEAMIATGTTSYLELGPGRVLAGLARRIDRQAAVQAVSSTDEAILLQETLTLS